MPSPGLETQLLPFDGERVEAPQLLAIELLILGERHHRAVDDDGAARREIAHERRRLAKRHADPSEAGVDADMHLDRTADLVRSALQRLADWRVHHRHDVARP